MNTSTKSYEDEQLELKEATVSIDRDGRMLPVFCVGPDQRKALPEMILIHEIFGVNDHIKDLARRFARQSLRVFAPDLFSGATGCPTGGKARNDLETMRNVWSSIPDSQLISDLKAVLSYARSSDTVIPMKIGAIGYCMGGAIAFMFACECPELAFVIDYYGRIRYATLSDTKPKHPIDYATTLACPILAIFAGIDDLIPPNDIDLFSKRLDQLGKTFVIKIYPDAKHAFFNDRRESYHDEAAQDAWQTTIAFVNKYNKIREILR